MPENGNKGASRGLSANAYVELGAGESYEPYVSAEQTLPEFTLKAAFFGILLGSGFVGGEGLLGVGIAAVAFVQNKKPDGIGTDWLGPHWVAQIVGLAAFGFLLAGFIRMVKR